MKAHLVMLMQHARWADERTLAALRSLSPAPDEAVNLFAHVVTTEQIYLERMRGNDPFPQDFWPELSLDEAASVLATCAEELQEFVNKRSEDALLERVRYRNSTGDVFETPLHEMLTHLALHGEHHRGQIARLVRKGGGEPAVTDYITFVREQDIHSGDAASPKQIHRKLTTSQGLATDPFSRQAQAYASFRPTYPNALFAYILSQVDRKRYAWDCGTGSGQVAQRLAEHFEKVYATDRSAAQLEHAAPGPNIEYVLGTAEKTTFPSDYFDLITAAQAIHWFDFDRFYEEVCRTGTEGCLVAVFGYGRVRVAPRIDDLIRQLYDKTFGTYYSENRRYVEEAYRTIPFPFEEIASPPFVIRDTWSLDQLEGYFSSWSAVQRMKSGEGYNPVDATMHALREKISSQERLNVSFDVFLRLGRISK